MIRLFSLIALLAFTLPSFAQDERVEGLLTELDYKFEIDKDNDFRMTFEFEDDRSQLIYINGIIEVYQDVEVLEVWAPVYMYKKALPKKLANELLEISNSKKVGAYEVRTSEDGKENMLIYVTKIPLEGLTTVQLDAFMHHVMVVADEKEKELTKGKDDW